MYGSGYIALHKCQYPGSYDMHSVAVGIRELFESPFFSCLANRVLNVKDPVGSGATSY